MIGSRRSRLFLRVGWREFHENGRVDFWVRDRDVALLFLASVEMGAANAKLSEGTKDGRARKEKRAPKAAGEKNS